MPIQQKAKSEFQIKDGRDVARYLVYFSKMKKWTDREINIVNISGISLYKKHKSACDKCLLLQKKYGIDLVKYLKFFSQKFNLNDSNADRIADPQIVMWYADELQILAKYERVYNYVLKSVDNIVDECIKNNYSSVREYLKNLIFENKLAEKYISGKISQYYLAGIKNLPQIVRKMDEISRSTLNEVVSQQDKLISDMQDAFTHFKMSRISIISYTNDRLNERISFISKQQTKNKNSK